MMNSNMDGKNFAELNPEGVLEHLNNLGKTLHSNKMFKVLLYEKDVLSNLLVKTMLN